MKNLLLLLFVYLIFCDSIFAQNIKKPNQELPQAKPKLVIGLVIDQMRWDYLHRYEAKYSERGFKRLMSGTDCTYTYYNYAPTYTGPGHASIFSGSTPALSGIAGNGWYDRTTNKFVYCVADSTYKTIGSKSKAGAMSPQYLLCSSIGDQLKIGDCKGAKVFGVALKDRSAILPTGHTADAAYWFDGTNGAMISSSFYMDTLPTWVQEFNDKKYAEEYLAHDWIPSEPVQGFHTCSEDALPYEGKFAGATNSAFPHNFAESKKTSLDVIRITPFGNTLTLQFAQELISNEALGMDEHTDLLSISFSAPDYIGHKFGPQSLEVEDCYLRLDRELAAFLDFIDQKIGLNNTLIFLTADHGAAEVPQYLLDMNIPAGILNSKVEITDPCKKWLQENYQDSTLYLAYDNQQIYLDRKKIRDRKLDLDKICKELSAIYLDNSHILNVLPSQSLMYMDTKLELYDNVKRGLHPTRSGDICFILQPGWFEDWTYGTTHGSSYTYDNHVPLLWYGWCVKEQKIYDRVYITDIAPTLSQILKIQEPNACVGNPIVELLGNVSR